MEAERVKRRRWYLSWRRWLIGLLAAGALFGAYAVERWGLHNFHEVVQGQVYRSAQPGPVEIRRWARQYGLRTVLNLRNDQDHPDVVAEIVAVREAGVVYRAVPLYKNKPPRPERLRQLIEALETSERPILIHCRAGADRSGVASVMAAMAIGGQDYATARKQLSIRYLRVPWFAPDCTDLLDRYESYCRREGLPQGGWQEFRRWALEVYPREQ